MLRESFALAEHGAAAKAFISLGLPRDPIVALYVYLSEAVRAAPGTLEWDSEVLS